MRKRLDDTNAWPNGVSIPSPAPSSRRSQAGKKSRKPQQSAGRQYVELFREGASIEHVQAETDKARSTVINHLAKFIEQERLTSPAPWMEVDETVYTRIRSAALSTGLEYLKPIHEALEGEVDYDTIRIVVACLKSEES